MKRPIKPHLKIVYSKNKAIIEAGQVLDYKKLGCPKCDTIYLRLSKKGESCNKIFFTPEEAIGICAALNWTVWHSK